MHEQVPGKALAVVAETPPAKKAHGIERPFRRRPQKRIPVDGLLAGIRRNGINPGASGRVAVPLRVNGVHLAQPSRGKNLSRLGVEDGADALAAGLEDAPTGLNRVDHREAVGHGVGHGLFAIDIFAGVHGGNGNPAVPVVGRADDDGVDIFARQNLFVIPGGEDLGAVHFFHVREAAVVAIAGRHQLCEASGGG